MRTQAAECYLVRKNHEGNGAFRLRPDIVARRGQNELRILDAKWKRLDGAASDKHYGITQADFYQMFAYGKKYREKEGVAPALYLLYPRNAKFADSLRFEFDDDLRLICAPVNLADETAPALRGEDLCAAARAA